MNDNDEAIALARAKQTRERCICLEADDGTTVCACPAPLTREQVGRLRAYASLHPERAIIYSEMADEWLAALHAFFPQSEDPILAWLLEPFALPPEADLQHASTLPALLDALGAPAVSDMS